MEDLKLFLDYFFKRFLFVSTFTCSTAGWLYGLIRSNFPIKTVSTMKWENKSPNVFSSVKLILNSLKGIFFYKDTL